VVPNGYVTFGLFQTPLKLNARVLDTVAAVLIRTTDSRLLIHYAIHDFDRPGRYARERIVQALSERGVDPARLSFRGTLSLSEHLELVSQVDIALDSFPYSGQTTTCECLWMGVPVVTLAGERFASRVSAAILRRAGFDDWVAESVPEYVDIAVRKASTLSELSALRGSMRAQFSGSPVMDGARVARELEDAYRFAWREWCREQGLLVSPCSLSVRSNAL
jgi:predicted O-linked N-acetylglucosamine transferase (SPINDLY family)